MITGGGCRWLLDSVIIASLTKFAVPCFIMISGCLLLDPKKKLKIKKIYLYIKRMIFILVLFGFSFAIIEAFISLKGENIFKILRIAFINLLQGNAWAHMWYIYCLIGLYILTPLLRKFTKYATNKEIVFTLISLFIFSTVIPTINNLFNLNITTFYLENFIYLFLYLCGYFIVNTSVIKEKSIYLGGVIGIIGYILCSYFNMYNSQFNVFMILQTIFIIKIFSNGIIQIKPNKFLKLISKYSFGIYIIHCFWLNLLNKGFHIYPSLLPVFVGEITFYLYALGMSLISAIIMYKVPCLKKILN